MDRSNKVFAADVSAEAFGQRPAWEFRVKRFFDFVVSSVALLLVWPILLIVSISIKFTSRGPVLYRGLRSGLNGEPFHIFKFRTMVDNAESLGGPTTGTGDPRVTFVGRILRKTKLDELPQFFNVLRGEMSLVGPRPEVIEYTSKYVGEEKEILSVRPGITDYSSIEFVNLDDLVGSEDPDAYFRKHILPRKNALRLKYAKEWTLTGDLRILWKTFTCLLKKLSN